MATKSRAPDNPERPKLRRKDVPHTNPAGNPSGQGGKEQRFTKEEVEAALNSTWGNVTLAAMALKCERQTIYGYFERYPELKLIRGKKQVELLDVAEGHLIQNVREGYWPAVTYMLDSPAGQKRGYGRNIAVTGPGGDPLQTQTIVNVHFIDDDQPTNGAGKSNGHDDRHRPVQVTRT